MTVSKIFGLLVLVCFSLTSSLSVAQKEVRLKLKFSPNKTYATTMVNDMKMEMDFTDTAKRSEIAASGLKLPMQMDMLQEMTLSTRTGAQGADKRVPLTISYDKVSTIIKLEGKEMKQPQQLEGIKIKGYATADGKLKIDSIEGNTAPEVKNAIETMVSQILNAVQFPEKAMKIGDTFVQDVPMVIPMAGSSTQLLIKVNYVLKEIKDNQAFFDYTQSVGLDLAAGQGNTKASGSGNGKMVYNIPASYITDTSGDIVMDMTVSVGEMNMKVNVKGRTSVKATIL